MPHKQNLQPLLDVRQNHLSVLFGTSDALDAKALGVIGFSAAALIFGLDSAFDPKLENLWWLVPLLLFTLSITAAVVAIWPRLYGGASVDIEKHPEYLSMSEDELLLQLLADTQESININTPLNERKANSLAVSILLAILATTALLPCIIKV